MDRGSAANGIQLNIGPRPSPVQSYQEGAIRLIRPPPATTFTPPLHPLPESAGVDTVFRVTNDVTPPHKPVPTRCQFSGVADTGTGRAQGYPPAALI